MTAVEQARRREVVAAVAFVAIVGMLFVAGLVSFVVQTWNEP